jgi:hypothetical protein
MAPEAQKEPSWIWGANKGPWNQQVHKLEAGSSFKELKFWLSWPQDFMALTPSVKRPLT